MFKSTVTAIALAAAAVTTTGCGLSYDYQRNSLLDAGPPSLCYFPIRLEQVGLR